MAARAEQQGPLTGVRVVELAGIGPGPFAGMLLADLGADVVRVDRPEGPSLGIDPTKDLTGRNKRSVVVDLKADGPEAVLRLVEAADILIEGNRPGVAERLGVGPDECLRRNPRLVYGRMTGWGQEGPLAPRAGHDIGYIAITGALGMIGPAAGAPVPPANLLGDYAGGSLYLVVGVLAALQRVRTAASQIQDADQHDQTRQLGQVVDAAIVDGTSHLTSMIHGMLAAGAWRDQRGVNLLDGSCPFYGVYQTADGGHLAVGALEPRFYAEFLALLGLDSGGEGPATVDSERLPPREDVARWGELREVIALRIRTRTRDEWDEVFAESDACVAPVLSLTEAPSHPHLAARGTYLERFGLTQPAPAPRFSATPTSVRTAPATPGQHNADVARDWQVPELLGANAPRGEGAAAVGARVPSQETARTTTKSD